MDTRILDTTMMALIAVIIIGQAQIPVMMQIINDQGGDVKPGETWTYNVTTNLDGQTPVTISISGSGQRYCTIDNQTITGTFPDQGNYSVIITASTQFPTQTATQNITVNVAGDSQYQFLLYVIPTILIVALIIVILRQTGIIDLTSSDGGAADRESGEFPGVLGEKYEPPR